MSIANKENISFSELEEIQGTGENGRVSKNDILNYIKNRRTLSNTKTNQQAIPIQSKL